MDVSADGGPFWDPGDDRSRVFAPAAGPTMAPLVRRLAPLPFDRSRFAANEETAAAALFLRAAAGTAR